LASDASLGSCRKFIESYQTIPPELLNTASEEMRTDIEEYDGALAATGQATLQYRTQCEPQPKTADGLLLCMQLLSLEGTADDAYFDLSDRLAKKYCAEWNP
jgi:hypothetical protein